MYFSARKLDLVRDESGSATIESVLWLPVFIAFFCLIADVSFIFYGQNRAHRIVQDANRSYSIGRLTSEDEVEAFIQTALAGHAPNALVQSQNNGTGVITTAVRIPTSDLVATGIFTSLVNSTITVGSSHFVEY